MSLGVNAYNTAAAQATALAPAADPTQQSAATPATKAAATSGGPTTNTTISSSGDQVSLSSKAQQLLSANVTATKHGILIFDSQGATVGGNRVALIDIVNNTDGSYTETERAAATRQINQRETAGFRWAKPTSQDPIELKRYYATYLNYLQKLPPQELNSSRYKGEIDHAKQLIKEADRQIALASLNQSNVGNYASGLGLLGPISASIGARISRQLANLPNTNLTSTARYYQQIIGHARSADQVLASPDPTAKSSNGTSGKGSSSSNSVKA